MGHTHFFVETFALAMHRCLMPSHPLHKMLKEHFRFIVSIIISLDITISSRFIISIDTLGRQVLIAPDGSADLSLVPAEAGPGVAVSTAGVLLLAVRVEEALEGEGPVPVVPSEVFTALSRSTSLLAGLRRKKFILPPFGN